MKTFQDKTTAAGHIHEYNLDIKNREIYLFGEIENDSLSCIKNLHYLSTLSDEPINLNLSTIGGSVEIGFGIYDAIKSNKCFISITCYGQIMSMGGIILQAADKRIIMPNTSFLIHKVYTGIEGSPNKIRALADMTQSLQRRAINILVDSSKKSELFKEKSEKQILNFYQKKLEEKEDWYLFGKEIIDLGLADEMV